MGSPMKPGRCGAKRRSRRGARHHLERASNPRGGAKGWREPAWGATFYGPWGLAPRERQGGARLTRAAPEDRPNGVYGAMSDVAADPSPQQTHCRPPARSENPFASGGGESRAVNTHPKVSGAVPVHRDIPHPWSSSPSPRAFLHDRPTPGRFRADAWVIGPNVAGNSCPLAMTTKPEPSVRADSASRGRRRVASAMSPDRTAGGIPLTPFPKRLARPQILCEPVPSERHSARALDHRKTKASTPLVTDADAAGCVA